MFVGVLGLANSAPVEVMNDSQSPFLKLIYVARLGKNVFTLRFKTTVMGRWSEFSALSTFQLVVVISDEVTIQMSGDELEVGVNLVG